MGKIVEKKVDLIKKVNVYFDGKITSRNYRTKKGVIKSLGIILPGQYNITTKSAENIEIISGKVSILLGGLESNWETYKKGDSFDIPANSTFEIEASKITNYCCTYL